MKTGEVGLALESLAEREVLCRIAPHLVRPLEYVLPVYSNWKKFYYSSGLLLYDCLAKHDYYPRSRVLSREQTLMRLPQLAENGLKGAASFWDGQFEDSRFAVALLRTALSKGAALLNYAEVFRFEKDGQGRLKRLYFRDLETGEESGVSAKCFVNASGAWGDLLRKLDEEESQKICAPTQGAHLVFPATVLNSNSAILVPETSDGRIMYAMPYKGGTLIGTTVTPAGSPTVAPKAFPEEIDFILETASPYFKQELKREQILCAYAGLRPLYKPAGGKQAKQLGRDFKIEVSSSGMLTIIGGKWTIYRKMAESCVSKIATLAELPPRECLTKTLALQGAASPTELKPEYRSFGADAAEIKQLEQGESLAELIHPEYGYSKAMVVYACRAEMARTVEDVLARRLGLLYQNAKAAQQAAPLVAELLARERGLPQQWRETQVQEFFKASCNCLP